MDEGCSEAVLEVFRTTV
ncbi:MAG: hypothetical protein ACLR8P_14720 [Clostridium fessum]